MNRIKHLLKDLAILIRANLWLIPVIAALVAAVFYFVAPPPPMSATMATGAEGGGYAVFAGKLREKLKEQGFELKLVPSAGSRDNLERLLGTGEVDIALVQSGHAELEAKLAPYISRAREATISYSALPDDTVLILQAIHALVGPLLTQGTFSLDDCEAMTPQGTGGLIDRLYKQNILQDDPAAAKPGTYWIQDEKLWFSKASARYFLPPDADLGGSQAALNMLFEREFSDSVALTELWLDHAVTDVMCYFEYQCDVHNHILCAADVDKIKATVRHGMRKYSVAQMWFIMWKVTRDAAALASRSYYNRETAAATIPNKIRKQLENADQGTELRNEWTRPEPHITGSLGMMFYSLFGLDEYTKGTDAQALFDRLGEKSGGEINLHALAAAFMKTALENESALFALEDFAEMVRVGLTTEDALKETIDRNPGLFQ